jgi:thiol-disulfide isomerase/thioredoxin
MKELADSLEKTLEERYAEVEKPWFRTHYRHALASLHEVADRNKEDSYERYFRDEEVRPYNEEYMKHFLAFYDKYLIDFARRHDSLCDLRWVLSRERDPGPILEALESKEAEHLGREGLRELVLIDGMFDAFYHRKDFDREGIHAVLDSLASKGSRKGIRETAAHLSDFLSKRQRGTKAPDFRLLDRDTNSVDLESLMGRPIYLNFWATWNETSLKDLRMIEKLHEEYGDQVHFVSISTDDKLRDMTDFLEEHPDYDWTFLYSGSKEEVEERYQVASIPAYYLLDAEARFLSLPGPKPGENARKKIHRLYKRILRKKKRRRSGRRGWDH